MIPLRLLVPSFAAILACLLAQSDVVGRADLPRNARACRTADERIEALRQSPFGMSAVTIEPACDREAEDAVAEKFEPLVIRLFAVAATPIEATVGERFEPDGLVSDGKAGRAQPLAGFRR